MVFKFLLIPDIIERVSENEIAKDLADKDDYIVKEVLVSESRRIAKVRNGQNVIRRLTLVNYSNQCAMCDVDEPEMLVASHIIPWAQDKSRRGVLDNLICLCVFHDVLFEQGKITMGNNYEIEFSEHFVQKCNNESNIYSALKKGTKMRLKMPKHDIPSKELLIKHRERFAES